MGSPSKFRVNRVRSLSLGPFKEIFAWMFRGNLLQFTQQFLHTLVDGLGNDNLQFHVLIPAVSRPPKRGYAFFPQTQLLTAVGAGTRRTLASAAGTPRGSV